VRSQEGEAVNAAVSGRRPLPREQWHPCPFCGATITELGESETDLALWVDGHTVAACDDCMENPPSPGRIYAEVKRGLEEARRAIIEQLPGDLLARVWVEPQ
jgi:hypothetical protein